MPKGRLYDNKSGSPCAGFNEKILDWLRGKRLFYEHSRPKAFNSTLRVYEDILKTVMDKGEMSRVEAHKWVLSRLTSMIKVDLSEELKARLSTELINDGGIRTTISQGVLKNTGENFVNLIVYAIADTLSGQDEVLVDKGPPPALKRRLGADRIFNGTKEKRTLKFKIEADFSIFSRRDPFNAIIGSAKTRLKEVFHVGTMWKLLFDTLCDEHCQTKWGLKCNCKTDEMLYVFATSDSISEKGKKSQGPDLKVTGVRNLIALDASFFDYVFVSKAGLDYVSNSLDFDSGRG